VVAASAAASRAAALVVATPAAAVPRAAGKNQKITNAMELKKGVYESLITNELQSEMKESAAHGLVCLETDIDKAESPSMLAEYLSGIIKGRLSGNLSMAERKDFANRVIELVSGDDSDKIAKEEQVLSEVIAADENAFRKVTKAEPVRPLSGFRVSNLFTGGQSHLSLASEIERDIVSADSISLIVSFLKLSGVNIIYDRLKEFCSVEGHKLRVITTTYCGITEAKAIQRLSELPNTEIRISYQADIERLHAKSYIFERHSGMSTAYIGSSNLSKSAQTDGLEWNIRVTNVENPHIIKTALAAFDRYWNSPNFEDFSVGGIERFEEKMEEARFIKERHGVTIKDNIFCRYTILPHQKQILDKLRIERQNGVLRNLIVAATGTGKTVISAFDYQQFQRENRGEAKILFVAHREEILVQALQTYRNVLMDGNFGDLWVGSHTPDKPEHLFVSVQTFNSNFDSLFRLKSPDFYDYIVIDEAHHSTADSYRKIIDHFHPKLLIGLTATPERMDGQSLLPDFCGKISAEIRLPKALNDGLLTPFQYFCISDTDTDLSDDNLMVGHRYVASRLYDKLCTPQRVGLVIKSLKYYLPDEQACKALCFCAGQEHANYMADMLNKAGLRAACLTASNNEDERVKLRCQLADGKINYLCVVDIFNEGVDIPEVDTVLFLRPTDSLTVFLQQLGRGLRLSAGKQVLTVLDFVSHLNSNYDYAGRFRSLMLRTDRSVRDQIKNGFTLLPYGCSIHLEEQAQQMVLDNISSAIYNRTRLANELRTYPTRPSLRTFIEDIDQDIRLIYRNGLCWTRLLRDAGKCLYEDDDNTRRFERGIGSLVHINTPRYLRFIDTVMAHNGDLSWLEDKEQPYVVMLYYSLFQERISKLGVESMADALSRLKDYPLFVREIRELVSYRLEHLEENTFYIGEEMPANLEQYGCYTREEVFALFGRQTADKKMQGSVAGVFNVDEYKTELLFVTLNKSDADFSPSTQYDDYVISEYRFHWQSQNTDSHSGRGRRYITHLTDGRRFLLFVREEKRDGFGNTSPFYCFGFVDYITSTGDRPMSIEWQMHQPILPHFIKAV
jgi:superfamily II DNA or RNA helicase/HKD family nuclease